MRTEYISIAVVLLAVAALAQQVRPMPTPPTGITLDAHGGYGGGTVLDTNYSLPTGGTTWAVHTTTDLANALAKSHPGDVIALDPNVIYSGNFTVPGKPNPSSEWIYITTTGFNTRHPPGTRITPAATADMGKIVSPNAMSVLTILGGSPNANYIRVVGVEFYSNSNYQPSGYTPGVYYSYALVGVGAWPFATPSPDHIIFDRIYIHGDAIHDIQTALQANFNNFGLVDSYCSDIHMKGTDTQCTGAFFSHGPFKIVNNYLSAAGENVMFGGSGKNADAVPSDIELRGNYLFKPLSWVALSSGTNPAIIVKNLFELKSAQRVLVDGNIMENNWVSGQMGTAIALTVRTSQDGDLAVVNDITITNNEILNVVSGIGTIAKDDGCGTPAAPDCHNAGSQSRWYIANNLFTFYNPALAGGSRNLSIQFSRGIDRPNGGAMGNMRDVILQHNTWVPNPATLPASACHGSVFFSTGTEPWPLTTHITDNIWVLDNVLCTEPGGQYGLRGATGLAWYMNYPTSPPNDLLNRFYGNVMLHTSGATYTWPAGNYNPTSLRWVDATTGNYQLASPNWTTTTDGAVAGIDYAELMNHIHNGGSGRSEPGPSPPTLTRF